MKNVRVGKEYKTKVFVGKEEIDVEIEMNKFLKTHKKVFGWWDIAKDGDNYVGIIVYR